MAENARQVIATAKELGARLQKVSDALDRVISEIGSTTQTSSTYWRSVETRLKGLYEEARVISRDWVTSKLPNRYNGYLSAAVRDLKQRVIGPPKLVDYKTLVRTLSVRQSLGSMLRETLTSLNTGFLSGEATLRRLTSATQQVLLSERRVNKAVEKGFMEEGSALASKRRLRDALLAQARGGKYITVVDRNGIPRQYRINAYAELVARTKIIEASSQSVIATAVETGSDLVQISSHNTKTPLCAEYEGKIFSISGKDPDFPMLDAEPPFHPNCMHTMTITFREALARDGTLEKYVDFSNDRTGEHPTREGFVPVAEREM